MTTPNPLYPLTSSLLCMSDLDFILLQVRLLNNAPLSPSDMTGLRDVGGVGNNIANPLWGTAYNPFLRLMPADFTSHMGEGTFGLDQSHTPINISYAPTSYGTRDINIIDSQPRIISNLVANSANISQLLIQDNPATSPNGRVSPLTGPDSPLPNSGFFALIGQFFDHGLDFVHKGQGYILIPLLPGDPLYNSSSPYNFMVQSRTLTTPATNDTSLNNVSPYIDLSQVYGSDVSHLTFLKEYTAGGIETGYLLSGATGHLPTWADCKANALRIGITLHDSDVTNIPLVRLNADGSTYFDANHHAYLVAKDLSNNTVYVSTSDLQYLANNHLTLQTVGSAFIDDMTNGILNGGYDSHGDLIDAGNLATLNAHFIAGDGRVNENYGITAIHDIFHSEHNAVLNELIALDAQKVYNSLQGGPAYTAMTGEELFQAAKMTTEMEYQHMIFAEFARKVSPGIQGFIAYDPSVNAGISAEFADAVYRLGHSMLAETIDTASGQLVNGTLENLTTTYHQLYDAFTNPVAFSQIQTTAGVTNAGQVVTGMSMQVGNEIDQWVTDTLRNKLLGLPMDLAALNISRGRDTGMPTLNEARANLFQLSSQGFGFGGGASGGDLSLKPYESWSEFQYGLLHPDTVTDFIMAYSRDTILTNAAFAGSSHDLAYWNALQLSDPTAYSNALANAAANAYNDSTFMNGGDSGYNNIDLWLGGLAEKHVTGGELGATFNFIFAEQMTTLQNGDRFYYLGRLAGTNMLSGMQGQLFSDIVMRNTGAQHLYSDLLSVPDGTIYISDYLTAPHNHSIGTPSDTGFASNGQFYANSGDYFDARVDKNPEGIPILYAHNALTTTGTISAGVAGLLETSPGQYALNNFASHIQTLYSLDNSHSNVVTASTYDLFNGNTSGQLADQIPYNPVTGESYAGKTVTSGTEVEFQLTDNATNTYTLIRVSFNTDVTFAQGSEYHIGSLSPNGTGHASLNIIDDVSYARPGGGIVIHGNEGTDCIWAGAGDDTIYSGLSAAYIHAGDGNCVIYGGAGNNIITGGIGSSLIYAGTGLDQVQGGDGNETIYGGSSGPGLAGDNLNGGAGNDLIFGDNGSTSLGTVMSGPNGQTPTVIVFDWAHTNLTHFAVATFNSTLPGASASPNNGILVNGVMDPTGAGDIIDGGTGDDLIFGGGGANIISGGDGNDTIFGGGGLNILTGGAGNDWFYETAANNGWNQSFDGGTGLQSYVHTGFDTVSYEFVDCAVNVDLGNRGVVIQPNNAVNAPDAFIYIQGLIGSRFSDSLIGDITDDKIEGRAGNDTLLSSGGNDTLIGGTGNDVFVSEVGGTASTIGGVSVVDTVTVTDLGGADNIQTNAATKINATVLADWNPTVTTVNLGAANITTSGYAVNLSNVTTSNGGSVNIYVLPVNPTVSSAVGINAITGAVTNGFNVINIGGATTITGSSGNDTITGGAQADTLIGGAGNDTYYVNNQSIVITEQAAGGTDTVISSISYSIAANANIENLTLTTGGKTATGNAGNNVLTSANTGLTDTLIGGGGTDTFHVLSNGTVVPDAYIQDLIGSDILLVDAGAVANAVVTSAWTATNATINSGVVNVTTSGLAVNLAAINAGNGFTVTNTGVATRLTGSATIADTLISGAGIDTLVGGSGNDTFYVNNASDSITGGGGIDTIVSSVTYSLAAHTDITNLSLSAGGLTATGNAAANTLTSASTGTDTLTGSTGIDTFHILGGGTASITDLGTGGAEILVVDATGTANATITAAWTATSSTVNNGVANVSTNGLAVNVSAATGSNGFSITDVGAATTLTGSNGNDSLTGGNGNDVLNGGLGSDTINGGLGNDTINGGTGIDNLTGGAGIDTFTVLAGDTATITDLGLGGADVLTVASGGTASATINTAWTATSASVNSGAVSITTAGLAVNLATVVTGNGFTITNTGGATTLTGSSGADTIIGGTGNDVLIGGVGADSLDGGLGNDIYMINAVADYVVGDIINDTAIGGADEIRFAATAAGTLVLNASTTGIESVTIGTGTAAAAVVTGTTALNIDAHLVSGQGSLGLIMTGNAGANILTGTNANDTINGGAGNDTIIGGAGVDNLTGGAGIDTFTVLNAETATITDLGAGGQDVLTVAVGGTATATINTAWTALATTVNNGAASISTNGLAVSVAAATGFNGFTITNTGGATTLTGSSGADTIIGGTGIDTIDGGAGNDILTGNGGADQFRFSVLSGLKTLTDFTTGSDKLSLNHLVFTGLATTLTGTTFVPADFTAAANHNALATTTSHLIYDNSGSGDHGLYYQASGLTNVVEIAIIGAGHSVAAADIVLY